MSTSPINTKLWTPRSVEETQQIYADWADGYDGDMQTMSYATPGRVADALTRFTADRMAPVLDFGCGTGLSGGALAKAGFTTIDGTDISPAMLDHARGKGIYRDLWLGTPGEVRAKPGAYQAIIATGVVSLGAAPPQMLGTLVAALGSGGLLAFSYNDPTLAAPDYVEALDALQANGSAELLFREHGPHLSEKVTGSDVIVLRRA